MRGRHAPKISVGRLVNILYSESQLWLNYHVKLQSLQRQQLTMFGTGGGSRESDSVDDQFMGIIDDLVVMSEARF